MIFNTKEEALTACKEQELLTGLPHVVIPHLVASPNGGWLTYWTITIK